jgi:hypothetical protein
MRCGEWVKDAKQKSGQEMPKGLESVAYTDPGHLVDERRVGVGTRLGINMLFSGITRLMRSLAVRRMVA